MHRQVLNLRKRIMRKKYSNTLKSINNLVSVLSSQGKYDKAEEIYRQALALRERILGKKHLSTLKSINNLAEILSSQGKYDEAEEMHK